MSKPSLSGQDKVVLAIGAHPDDMEFGCGGTLAKLASEGAQIYYIVATDGNRGSRSNKFVSQELIKQREQEQHEAGKIIGCREIFFLNQEDGNLIADLKLKEKLVRIIRQLKPDMVFTHDPSWIYSIDQDYSRVNHNDHRQVGIATLDALYPLARDLSSFPEHSEEGLTPHTVVEVYLFMSRQPNFFVDISGSLEQKIASILAHKSQIDQPEEMAGRIRSWAEEAGKMGKMKLAEGFARLTLR